MLEIFLLAVSIALFLALILLIRKILSLRKIVEQLRFEKGSQAVKYGKLTEQFIPFIEEFPYNPEGFRFLGSPIDGVLFDEDLIVFCEFKTASGNLNQKQRRIKQLVNEKKVKWFEFKLR